MMRMGSESQPEKAGPAGQHLALLRRTNTAAKPLPQGGGISTRMSLAVGLALPLRRAKLDASPARLPVGRPQAGAQHQAKRVQKGIRCARACPENLNFVIEDIWQRAK